jgi:hypothetical protein
VGSNPAEDDDDGFLRAIKIRSMISFGEGGGGVRLCVPCCKILQHVKDPYSVKEVFYLLAKFTGISPKFLPALLLCVCWLLRERSGG